MKTGIIIQARTGSSRLPGKVLLELPYESGITVLSQVIRRSLKSQCKRIIVATTEKEADNTIVSIAKQEKVEYFRGPEDDVLARYYFAAQKFNLDIIVRVTSDCPCIHWQAINKVLEAIFVNKCDYVRIVGHHPLGTEDVEAFTFGALEKAFFESSKDFEREHVSPYFYYSAPEKFKSIFIESSQEIQLPEARVVLDTIEDYALLCAIYDFLYHRVQFFNTYQIVSLFRSKPWLKLINQKVVQKRIFENLAEELEEALKILKLQDLRRAVSWMEQKIKKENSDDDS